MGRNPRLGQERGAQRQVYPPQCVCPCVQGRPPQPPARPKLSEAGLRTHHSWWAGGGWPHQHSLRGPSCRGRSPAHSFPFPSRSPAGLSSPRGPYLPHHPIRSREQESIPARPRTCWSLPASLEPDTPGPWRGCMLLIPLRLPTLGPRGSTLPFPGQELGVPEVFHLPAGWTVVLPG